MPQLKIKFVWLLFILPALIAAKGQENLVISQIRIVPDKTDWTYELNQSAKFQISVTLNGNSIADLPLKYANGLVKVSGIYSWEFNDEAVPPTSSFTAYNVISATKKLFLGLEMGHVNSPEQGERIN
jgi:hypothetical protein